MRIKLLSPVLAAGLVATGLALMVTSPSQAAPVKLFFHSAGGGYLNDVQDDPFGPDDDSAPDGSTLDAKAPTKTADSEARGGSPFAIPGGPLSPTFTLPFVGDVTSVCLDVWFKSSMALPVYDFEILTRFNTPAAQPALTNAVVTDYAGGGALLRVTALVKPAGEGVTKIAVPKDSEFMINGYWDTTNDATLVYDSVAHPSSITLNATECKAAPVVVPSGGATPSPGGSATPTPEGSATPTPGGSATPTPGGSATPSATPSGTPTPVPTTPPAPAQETGLDYTGATSGRYGDTAPVSAKVTLPDGSPVPTGSVEFVLGGVTTRFPVNSSGIAAGRMPVRAGAGEQFMTVQYVANSAYLGTREQVPFSVSRMPTRCAVARTVVNGSYVITGTLRDAAGRAVVGQSLLFSYNNRTWKAVKTDRNGRASVTVAPRAGTYAVALPTNAYYTGCSAALRA